MWTQHEYEAVVPLFDGETEAVGEQTRINTVTRARDRDRPRHSEGDGAGYEGDEGDARRWRRVWAKEDENGNEAWADGSPLDAMAGTHHGVESHWQGEEQDGREPGRMGGSNGNSDGDGDDDGDEVGDEDGDGDGNSLQVRGRGLDRGSDGEASTPQHDEITALRSRVTALEAMLRRSVTPHEIPRRPSSHTPPSSGLPIANTNTNPELDLHSPSSETEA